jgi:biotin transporter BioY
VAPSRSRHAAGLAGLAGLTWLALYAHLGPAATLREGLTPFIAGDAIKAAIAAGLLPTAWRLAGRRAGRPDEPGEPG